MPVDPSATDVIPPVLSEAEGPGSRTTAAEGSRSSNNEPKPEKESHLRSLMKAMSWRILATLTTILIAYFITGQIDIALMIGSIEFVLKFLIYYLHERAWQLVPRGSIRRLVHWDTDHS